MTLTKNENQIEEREREIPATAPDRLRQVGTPDVIITTRWEAARWCHQFDSVLTVFTPSNYCEWGHKDHKVVEFQDRILYDEGAPVRSQIADILEWAQPRRNNSILIHCKAGQSRSVGTAIAINASWGFDEEQSVLMAKNEYRGVDKLESRPFIPNLRVLEHADSLLGTNLLGYIQENEMELGGFNTGDNW